MLHIVFGLYLERVTGHYLFVSTCRDGLHFEGLQSSFSVDRGVEGGHRMERGEADTSY